MQKLRVLTAIAVVTLAPACGGSDGTAPPEVASVLVTPGQATLFNPGETQQFAAQPLDGSGTQINGVTVTWSSSNNSVATVNSSGLATAAGTGTAVITATAQGKTGTATLTVIGDVDITSTTLANGRLTLAYDETIEVTGAGTVTFTLSSGTLPAGITLGTSGRLTGTPTALGTSVFTVQAEDSQGNTDSQQFNLTVCEAPETLDVGESWIGNPTPPGGCGFFMPAGADGDYYRVAVVRTGSSENQSDVQDVDLTITGIGGVTGALTVPPEVPSRTSMAYVPRISEESLLRRIEMDRATLARHAELRREEASMMAAFGKNGLLPDLREAGPLAAPARVTLPDEIELNPTQSCSTAGTKVTAVKLAEDDNLAVYQDETQNADPDTWVLPGQAQLLVDYYTEYGKTVIDAYFGGVPDINGDGKVIAFITPAVSGGTAGETWGGDFYDESVCLSSNEREVVYLNQTIMENLGVFGEAGSVDQGLETLVHEMKHVSSLYERIENGVQQPLWVEEGTAEIAAEVTARSWWADAGGPAMTDMLDQDDWLDGGDVTDETYGILLRLYRVQEALGSQPNGLTAVPTGARPGASVYGSWVFFRWLGDAYGGAGEEAMGDAELFQSLNDASAASGITGLTQETGRTWQQLLEEYVQALMTNGLNTPDAEKPFTTYDLVTAIEIFCFSVSPAEAAVDTGCGYDNPNDAPGVDGFFPWPVTVNAAAQTLARSFASGVWEGSSGPGGIRFHDFRSNGTGLGAEIHVDAPAQAILIVRRLQ